MEGGLAGSREHFPVTGSLWKSTALSSPPHPRRASRSSGEGRCLCPHGGHCVSSRKCLSGEACGSPCGHFPQHRCPEPVPGWLKYPQVVTLHRPWGCPCPCSALAHVRSSSSSGFLRVCWCRWCCSGPRALVCSAHWPLTCTGPCGPEPGGEEGALWRPQCPRHGNRREEDM